MGFADSLKSIGSDALHSAADTAYDKAVAATGAGTPKPAPTIPQGTAVGAGLSPQSAESLHFSPSGILAYAKSNPVKGGLLILALIGAGYLVYKRLR